MIFPRLVQEAMRKAEAAGNDDCPVKIKLVAPPAYVLNTQTLDKVTNCLLQIILVAYFTWVKYFLFSPCKNVSLICAWAFHCSKNILVKNMQYILVSA